MNGSSMRCDSSTPTPATLWLLEYGFEASRTATLLVVIAKKSLMRGAMCVDSAEVGPGQHQQP